MARSTSGVRPAIPESDGLFHAPIAATVGGVVVIDSRGTAQVCIAACERLFGFSCRGIIGRNIENLTPEPCHAEHDGHLSNCRDSGERRIIGIGRITFPTEPTNRNFESVDKVVEEAVALGFVGAADNSVKVRLDLNSEFPIIFIKKIQFRQVQINPIRNSIEYVELAERRELMVSPRPRKKGWGLASRFVSRWSTRMAGAFGPSNNRLPAQASASACRKE